MAFLWFLNTIRTTKYDNGDDGSSHTQARITITIHYRAGARRVIRYRFSTLPTHILFDCYERADRMAVI